MKITFQKEQKLNCSVVHCLTLFSGEGLERRNRPCGEYAYGHLQILNAVLCFGHSHDTLMTD